MIRHRRLFTIVVVLALAAPGLIEHAEAAGICRSQPLANVWSPSRLKVISPCATARGTVQKTAREGDGDIHIEVRLASGGHIRGEIVPADQPGCTMGQKVRYGVCTGAHVATPKVGSVISMTGPKVKDTRDGGIEIHPVWRITKG
jgi:hypothetical protein